MAKQIKKDEKKILLRLKSKAFEQLRKAAAVNNRSVNGEIAYTIEEKYL
jgi:hypothetical protein